MSERVATIGMVGAGTMGTGIAQVAILAGLRILLYDAVGAALAKGRARIAQNVSRGVGQGLVQPDAAEEALRRLVAVTHLSEMRGAEFILESTSEDLSSKQRLFAELTEVADPGAILATNTSCLSITAIGMATRRPERMVGMHFFRPVAVNPLVEVVEGQRTDPDIVKEAMAIARRLGKTPVRAKDTPGFIVNRIARHFSLEALRILGEGGVSHDRIDRAMKGPGRFPMGPFELMDLVGIDVSFATGSSVYEGFFHEPRFRPHPLERRMVDSGLLGRKTGRGFYGYPDAESG